MFLWRGVFCLNYMVSNKIKQLFIDKSFCQKLGVNLKCQYSDYTHCIWNFCKFQKKNAFCKQKMFIKASNNKVNY